MTAAMHPTMRHTYVGITCYTPPSYDQTATRVTIIRPQQSKGFRVQSNGNDFLDRYVVITAVTGTLTVRIDHVDDKVVAHINGHVELQSYSDGEFNATCVGEIVVSFL